MSTERPQFVGGDQHRVEIAESEERYRKLVQLLPEGVVVHAGGVVQFVNAAAVRLWAASSRSDLEGAEYMRLLHPDDRAFVQSRIDSIYSRGETSALREYRIIALDGRVVSIEAAGTLINYRGRPANLVLFRDITQRKRDEKRLSQTMERYRSLFENSPVPLWEEDWSQVRQALDARGESTEAVGEHLAGDEAATDRYSQMMHLTDANLACVQFFDAKTKQETLENMSRLLPEEAPIVRAALIGLWGGQNPVACEGSTRTLSGERRSVIYHFTISPGSHDTWDKVLISVIDQTVQKRAEEERRRLAQRLIEMAENDRRSIAMELHDHFGQVLTSLKMDLEYLAGPACAKNREAVERLGSATAKVMQTIADLRRLASGLMPDMIENLGLEPALRALVDGVKPAADVEIVSFFGGDPARLGRDLELTIYRIAQESLNNALKHARAKRIFISLVTLPEVVSISIEDDGIGFALDSERAPIDEGGPLGLKILRERVAQMNGELTIESRPAHGTMILAEFARRNDTHESTAGR